MISEFRLIVRRLTRTDSIAITEQLARHNFTSPLPTEGLAPRLPEVSYAN
jgi:hypothetical protein